jgi:hypothetical protein
MHIARNTSRSLATLAVVAGLTLTASPAHAQRAAVVDRAGDATSAATDVTALTVRRGPHRVVATVTIPGLVPRRLSGTELLIQSRGRAKAYAVTVLRDRGGRVVDRALSWRPLNDPVEPARLPCARIRTHLHEGRTTVSVPQRCLTRTRTSRPVRVKVRVVDGTVGLGDSYFDDQTAFTRFLH